MTSRRLFIQIARIASVALLGSRVAFAADVDPKDPQALALGYVADATMADKGNFPKYAAGQQSCRPASSIRARPAMPRVSFVAYPLSACEGPLQISEKGAQLPVIWHELPVQLQPNSS